MTTGRRWRTGHIQASDGLRLHYRALTVDEPRAAVLVVHGMFEHSGRYTELAGTLAEAGFSTFALDLRGHGESEGRRGHVRRFERFPEDVDRFVEAVAAGPSPALPRFLVAHSLGGLIGLRYLEVYDPALAGAVICSPWLETAIDVPAWQHAAALLLDRVLPIFPFPSDLDPELLSHDPERVRDYRDDPKIHSTITPRLFRETAAAGDRAFEERHRIAVPTLFLLAGDDRIVDTDRSVELARSLSYPDVTTRVLEGYYHEVLQETGRAAVMAELRQWLEARLP